MKKITEYVQRELAALSEMPDEDIDYSNISETSAQDWSGAGLARYKARDIVGAIEGYSQAVAADPQCQEAQEHLDYALEEQKDILSEIGHAREQLALHPDDVQVRFRLAQRLEVLGKRHEALAELREVSQIDQRGNWGKSAQKRLQKHAQQMTV